MSLHVSSVNNKGVSEQGKKTCRSMGWQSMNTEQLFPNGKAEQVVFMGDIEPHQWVEECNRS